VPLLLALPLGLFVLARQRRHLVLFLASLVLASQLATYWSPSFALVRNHYGWCNARFFMLVPTIAALLAPSFTTRWRHGPMVLAAYFVLAATLSMESYLSFFPSEVELVPLLAYAGSAFAFALAWPRIAAACPDRALGTGALCIAAVALVLFTPVLQHLRAPIRHVALTHSKVGHRFPWEWTEFAYITDEPDRPRRIAIVSGPFKQAARQLIYFYLGTKLQNELVYISPLRDGSIPVFDRPHPDESGADEATWLRRLRASGADFIALLSPPWVEARWIARHPELFHIVAGNSSSVLIRLRKPSAGGGQP
jgi:hypothetical protein